MVDLLTAVSKVSLVVFMAGNLLDMGLRLDLRDALRGLRNVRFVAYTLLWGFVLGPALAYAITLIIPLEEPYAMGLILIGMTPCAPFLPAIAARGRGDLGFTAAFMLVTAVGTMVFMPFAVPLMVRGLFVSAWAIARPLLLVVLLPLAIGVVLRQASSKDASRLHPFVKVTTGIATALVAVSCAFLYGKDLLGVAGSFAITSQLIFFSIVTALSYWLGMGLLQDQKIVLSAGLATRNIGAALAPLLSATGVDQRAEVMVVLALPIMVVASLLSVKWLGVSPSKAESDSVSSMPEGM